MEKRYGNELFYPLVECETCACQRVCKFIPTFDQVNKTLPVDLSFNECEEYVLIVEEEDVDFGVEDETPGYSNADIADIVNRIHNNVNRTSPIDNVKEAESIIQQLDTKVKSMNLSSKRGISIHMNEQSQELLGKHISIGMWDKRIILTLDSATLTVLINNSMPTGQFMLSVD